MGNKKTAPKAKEPIKVRFKELANCNKSVYLDFYRNGKREYEFLKLYLNPKTDQATKQANEETLRVANAIKARKVVELQNSVHGFSVGSGRSKINIIDYIKSIADRKRTNAGGGNRTTGMSYLALAKQIENYSGLKATFKQVDKNYCIGFIEHLRTAINKNTGLPLSVNTQVGYMKRFETVINYAISDEVTNSNPFKQIKPENKPKKRKKEITYLTIEEVKMLENTESLIPYVRQAFLFSCYTGLRFSDVKGLTWGDIRKDNVGETFINHTQKKTKKHEYLPIPQKAVEFLSDKTGKRDTDNVFYMQSGGYINLQLKAWAALAGLKKHLTFHMARHTYATILLSLGAPLEIISENLGHSDPRITKDHYAAIENKVKRAAVSLFDKLNGLTD
jgi:integrase